MNTDDRGPGATIRLARQARGLTLADLGQLTGYSASQISRLERGATRLKDVGLIRRFAEVLGIPPQALGLLPEPPARHASHGTITAARAPSVVSERIEDGEGPVRRRQWIRGAAGLAGATALGIPRSGASSIGDPAAGLETLLYGAIDGVPADLGVLHGSIDGLRTDFQAARYDRLANGIAPLIATAEATREHAGSGDQAAASVLLADAYAMASGFCVKLNDDQLAWATADRAVQAALASGDPIAVADARKAVATVTRRMGKPARARDLLTRAAADIEPDGRVPPEQLAMYGNLHLVLAYTAAVDGDRASAASSIAEAKASAVRLGGDDPRTAFGPGNVTLYQVSVAQVLGDNGTAIELGRALRPNQVPTRERQGRYWVDVARAWHQWGKPEQCYRALRSAERAAPAEVRYRPPVRKMTADLLRNTRRGALPGLGDFAARVGVPA